MHLIGVCSVCIAEKSFIREGKGKSCTLNLRNIIKGTQSSTEKSVVVLLGYTTLQNAVFL